MDYFALFLSLVLILHLYERNLHKVTKAFLHISFILFIISLLEVLKRRFNIFPIQLIEDIIGLTLIPSFYAFSEDFLGKKRNPKKRLFISIPVFILILPNFFSNKKVDLLFNNKILGTLFLIYTITILVASFRNLIKAEVKKAVKYVIVSIFSILFVYISIEILFLKFNTTHVTFFTVLSFLISEFVLIRKSWLSSLEEIKQKLLMTLSDGIILVDKKGYVMDLNETASKIIRLDFNNIVNKTLSKNFDEGEIIFQNESYYMVKKIPFEDGTAYFFRDVTKEMEFSKKHNIADKLFSTLFKNIPDGVAIITPKGKIIDCNKQFTKLFGLKRLENLETIVPPLLKQESKLLILEVLKNGYATYETIRRSKDGKEIYVKIKAIKFEIDDKVFIYTIYTDISKEKTLSEQLTKLIEKDPLTNTYNKTYITKQIKYLSNIFFHSLIFVDIKDFKWINSIKGYKYGNELLRNIAAKLMDFVSEEKIDAIISRAQNDEFWILIKDIDIDSQKAYQKNKKLIEKIKQKLSTFEQKFYIGSHLFKNSEDLEEIIRKTTLALSKSKDVEMEIVYSKEMEEQVIKEVTKEIQIKQAIKNRDFIPFLQPISKENMEIVGAEMLLRWEKEGKIIPPSDFLDYIERSGQIHEISLQVFEKTMEFLKKHPNLKFIDVNISPIQLKDKNFFDEYLKIIEKFNISPKKIAFEITENLFLSYDEQVKENISKIKKEGIKLCLDDFGTGYSSLSYLRNLPFDMLKIDREFIKNIDNERNTNLLKAIYSICETFNLTPIPEGVETVKQLEILSMIGFKLFQGYYFGKPMSLEEFEKIVS
ncbi:diguanylate cyclase [Thermosipho melanesiensis]|uniref:Diguanylate cyclase/phosphodiesterase with PAS/PAC sensor(S) n=2 Tax=Thermosipho melanesiensis TaxID=46541 RepID=A6LL12_THEM4|nr:EAL domain-containing protein [Thermosipho melanesiensis]ABR30613.1 diguanylate cyclase/phosphodiesterase with PAS/PAC sensor(s) [Thermosipho melanesiensis BI429]APT73753.1 diguanylate cyclase [Thermosipho melanesiensis]OOC35694.1 diguanylate cyclase [Thermosipho melanesiensis]OOC38993.1 diguanylate cyclase [Thermosipho melanesiensis]OOC39141.1 diguanylate cyclase [Thermosipho melanesiensis]